MGFALTNSLQLRPEQEPATKISQHSTRQHELGSVCKGGKGMKVGRACVWRGREELGVDVMKIHCMHV